MTIDHVLSVKTKSKWGMPAQSMQGQEIDYQKFRSIVASPMNGNKKLIMYAYSPNCPHCRMFSPQWDSFIQMASNKATDFSYYKMDATKPNNRKILSDYNITSYPAVMLMTGQNMIREMDPGMGDMNMGVSWLTTASGLPPSASSAFGGFP